MEQCEVAGSQRATRAIRQRRRRTANTGARMRSGGGGVNCFAGFRRGARGRLRGGQRDGAGFVGGLAGVGVVGGVGEAVHGLEVHGHEYLAGLHGRGEDGGG